MYLTNRQILEHLQSLSETALEETFAIKTNCVYDDNDNIVERNNINTKNDSVYIYVDTATLEKDLIFPNVALCNIFTGVMSS